MARDPLSFLSMMTQAMSLLLPSVELGWWGLMQETRREVLPFIAFLLWNMLIYFVLMVCSMVKLHNDIRTLYSPLGNCITSVLPNETCDLMSASPECMEDFVASSCFCPDSEDDSCELRGITAKCMFPLQE